MNEPALPLFARWALYALGATEGGRQIEPRDPVAAWLLRAHPELEPSVKAPERLARIRTTTELVDELVIEELTRAKKFGIHLAYWTFGGAFDARWYRMMRAMAGTVHQQVEVEIPRLLQAKSRMLGASTYTSLWTSILQRSLPEQDWELTPVDGLTPLVVLQGLWWRLDEAALDSLLRHLIEAAPTVRVVMDLPGEDSLVDGPWWPNSYLRELGYEVDLDLRLKRRYRVASRHGAPICGGMEALRLVKLSGRGR